MPELQVTVKRAVDLRDVQMIGRQDPYCDVLLGNLAFRARVHENGGTDPFWEETFVIPVANKNSMCLSAILAGSVMSTLARAGSQ
ncbi:hypothetical protein Ae201684P_002724 [Aphanomyces euteiches]|uniref:C2 domain-containing protein n=1 Tax=Aphanomyces euteiches TaxID=100861 RepID=A0A6G0X227_9STRA|nr:hypothetical protein Ae201684_009391 [Aphanomyces euteiches]KAH9070362.1 hypothetical protein Ae201684P_002724 [Aphanomyces euteiches]